MFANKVPAAIEHFARAARSGKFTFQAGRYVRTGRGGGGAGALLTHRGATVPHFHAWGGMCGGTGGGRGCACHDEVDGWFGAGGEDQRAHGWGC